MSIFAIGDLHLSFASGKPMDIYGEDWVNHTERLRNEWEDSVSVGDTVILVGDNSWALKIADAVPDLDWIHRLPGEKVFIRGNHDYWWNSVSKLNSLYDDMYFLQNTCYETEDIGICGSRGWSDPNEPDFTEDDMKIYKRELIRMEMSLKRAHEKDVTDIIVAIHYPPASSDGRDTEFTTLFDRYNVSKVVYGHLHGEEAYEKGFQGRLNDIDYRLVSLDYLDCKPLLLIK